MWYLKCVGGPLAGKTFEVRNHCINDVVRLPVMPKLSVKDWEPLSPASFAMSYALYKITCFRDHSSNQDRVEVRFLIPAGNNPLWGIEHLLERYQG